MKVPILFGWISTIILQNKNFYCHLRACFFSFPLSSSGSFLLLSSSGTFFSCHPRTLFSPVMFGLEPDISLTDSPVKPGNDEKEKKPGNDEKEKKLRNDEREKKRGMTIRRGEPAMTGGRESTNTAGEKTSPGCVKEAERSARRRGCLV